MKKINLDIAGSGKLLTQEQMKKVMVAGYGGCKSDVVCNLYVTEFGATYQGICGGPDADNGACYCWVIINDRYYSTGNGGRECYE